MAQQRGLDAAARKADLVDVWERVATDTRWARERGPRQHGPSRQGLQLVCVSSLTTNTIFKVRELTLLNKQEGALQETHNWA